MSTELRELLSKLKTLSARSLNAPYAPLSTSEARLILAALPPLTGDAQDSDPCQGLRLMLTRIIQRHRAGSDLTETLDGAADLLRRQKRVFRAPTPAGDKPSDA